MAVRIARADKNEMRARIEEVLVQYKDLHAKIAAYATQTEVEEYQDFWRQCLQENRRITERLSRYMVIKCNR
ncbi:MAG TPA: hypothetical protein PLC88_00570 [Syntrophomonas sp.]|nr:hypothetical protein [Syntrophomonas sp.]HRW13079.1 hypothetical protein [Syntrophomonas sp.]